MLTKEDDDNHFIGLMFWHESVKKSRGVSFRAILIAQDVLGRSFLSFKVAWSTRSLEPIKTTTTGMCINMLSLRWRRFLELTLKFSAFYLKIKIISVFLVWTICRRSDKKSISLEGGREEEFS